MAVAFLQEWKGATSDTTNYDAVGVKLDVESNPPDGLVVHAAGLDSNGVWHSFDIWDSAEQAQRFQEERLMPAVNEVMQEAGAGADRSPPDTTEMFELHDLVHPHES